MEGLQERSTVDANGVPLHVAVDGTEGAPWVTMLHGLATNMTLFDQQEPAAQSPGFRARPPGRCGQRQ
ncbi:MAG: alpha/beta hydrolase, partial [Pseudomonadota bacterium]